MDSSVDGDDREAEVSLRQRMADATAVIERLAPELLRTMVLAAEITAIELSTVRRGNIG